MPRPVARITARPPSYEEMIRELRIPRPRQRQLRAIVDQAREKLQAERQAAKGPEIKREETIRNASAAD